MFHVNIKTIPSTLNGKIPFFMVKWKESFCATQVFGGRKEIVDFSHQETRI